MDPAANSSHPYLKQFFHLEECDQCYQNNHNVCFDKSIYCPPTINMREEGNGSSPLTKAMRVGQKDVLIDCLEE